ncbi:MAG TPA: Mur ligase family protein [Bacteriovoracaceae bacterium]|nr:Mur ligase family protein [Bacteriovoracaceae bacterium]
MDLTNLISQDDLIKRRHQIKKVFFYRICGAGMGPAAVLIKQAGFQVEGADSAFYPPMSTFLESTGIPLFKLDKVTPEFLQQYDLIVVGNSVSGKLEAARMIEKTGVPFTSFPSALGSLVLKDKNVVGIAGTHGKTTTTYFLTQLLEKLGQNPGYLVGGIIEGRDPSKLGDKYFVIESDEYDSAYFHKISKFRLYEMKNMILTSLEFDHADIFSSVEKIEDEFRAILSNISSTIIINQEYPSAMKLHKEFAGKRPGQNWHLYGKGSEMGPHQVQTFENGSSFSIKWKGEMIPFKSNVVGEHNVLNVSSCLYYLLTEGFPVADIQKAASELEMVKRRQEIRGKYQDMVVIDDFAHHPRAITVTMDAIRARFKGRKIITVFEPISATARSSIFQNEFRDSLAASDKVIIAKADIAGTAMGAQDLDGDRLALEINTLGKPATCVRKLEDLRKNIDEYAEKNAVLLILSNRTCLGLWESSFVQELKA